MIDGPQQALLVVRDNALFNVAQRLCLTVACNEKLCVDTSNCGHTRGAAWSSASLNMQYMHPAVVPWCMLLQTWNAKWDRSGFVME